MDEAAPFDLIVIGGGFGGLATAGSAQRAGFKTALLEAHTKLGGCAGYFERGPYTFDAGATALMGLGHGEPIGDLLDSLGLDFQGVPTPSYRVHLPDRTLDVVSDPAAFEAASARAFPSIGRAGSLFWKLQAAVGETLFRAAGRVPRLPLRSFGDLAHDLRVLGLSGLLAASTWVLTVEQVLRLFGLADDRPFHSLIAMLLQDTAQAGPETVPFANAAACLHAYRLGMSRPQGGMKALAEGIGERFAAWGGDLRTATLVDRVEQDDQGVFLIKTRRRQTLRARQVVFNLPIDLSAKLLGRSLEGRLGRLETKSRAAWSAFTAYLAIDRAALPDDGPLFHQVLQDYDKPIHDGNNALISLSPPGDLGYGPAETRVATMSTHVRPSAWTGLDPEARACLKAEYARRMLAALRQALPEAAKSLKHAEFATPQSFQRYTRRHDGAVGGPPARLGNTNLCAVGADALGPGLWLVGDSVFPGQGTMAVVLSAKNVVDRLRKAVH